jgi:hypothetical protein
MQTPPTPGRLDDAISPAAMSFSARLRLRRALWWGRPFRWTGLASYRDALHRARERFAPHASTDPEASWRCCPFWPRTLIDKAASRAYAQRHGCALPALYWQGRSIARMPLATLPGDYVVRPTRGTAAAGVYVIVDGRELLRDIPLGAAALRRRLWREHGPYAVSPLLVEAFVPPEPGGARMPVEYKCHVFGDRIGAVQVLERTGQLTGVHRYYTARWETFADPMDTNYPLAPRRPAPPYLDEMLAAATRIGQAIGTYMRVDFFGSAAGPIFNELSSTPQVRTRSYTARCDAMFGALWQAQFPDAL